MVIACKDPFDQVNGIGIKKLITAGIEVEVNVMEKESMEMNIRFLTSIVKNRPYIILKWAQTADNFIARENFDSKWISNKYSRKLVHQWRAHEDAILVGKNSSLIPKFKIDELLQCSAAPFHDQRLHVSGVKIIKNVIE